MTPVLPRACDVLVVAGLAIAAVTVLLLALGYRPLVVRSGSMAPTLEVGDLVVSRSVPAGAIRPGELVTFRSPTVGGLVTHRVVSVTASGTTFEVRTRGDANRVPEDWTVPADGTVGAVVGVVPWAGWLFGPVSMPAARIALVLGCCGLLLRFWLVRIWRDGG